MKNLKYEKHEVISLREQPDFSEAWLHDRICDDPSILGLGEVVVIDRERVHDKAGRLDILLYDEEDERRFEVEIMLGSTDPSHIIRCIEYWDIERRRYPAYEHVAVLIAEDVTSRFLNVMALLAGSIPLIAIQLKAIKVADHLLLNFTHVLDQASLPRDDESEVEQGGGVVGRSYWEDKVGTKILSVCDKVLAMINRKAQQPQSLVFRKSYIGLSAGNQTKNFMYFYPKRSFVHVGANVSDAPNWVTKFSEAGISASIRKSGRVVRITAAPNEIDQNEQLFQSLSEQAVKEYED